MALGYDRQDSSVVCPYYESAVEKTIVCEGGMDPQGHTETRFKTKERRREYMEKYCRSCFGACEICKRNDSAHGFTR